MAEETLRYDRMMQEALRGIVRQALATVAETGFPGAHHFYITFRTRHPGVDIPQHLHATYPDEMTIVLQHQFYGLEIDDVRFSVTLSFRKRLERLTIPFAAVTAFVDPGVNFGLQFQPDEAEGPRLAAVPADAEAEERPDKQPGAAGPAPKAGEESGEKIVSLDAFRKK